jgi:hypothetical protein
MEYNASVLKKIEVDRKRANDHYERIQKIRKVLGQHDKKQTSYTPLPKLETLQNDLPPTMLEMWLDNVEIMMHCKDACLDIIGDIESKDPVTVSQQVLEDLVATVEKKLTSPTGKTCHKPPQNVKKSCRTWKERAIIMFFYGKSFPNTSHDNQHLVQQKEVLVEMAAICEGTHSKRSGL